MPKYLFQCEVCDLQFERTLKADTHKNHPCPQCREPSPRYWPGQGFAAQFAEGGTPGNSGVATLDYPTADRAVGADADKKWAQYSERDKVKAKVRKVGETHKLSRKHIDGAIEYRAMGSQEATARSSLAKEAVSKLRETPAR